MKVAISSILRRNAEFVTNVTKLVSGSGLALLISLILTPLVARVFVPEDYGVVSLLLAVAKPLVVLGTLQLGVAIVLPKEREQACALFDAAATWLIWVSAALLLVGLVLVAVGAPLPFSRRLGQWVWAIPVAVFLFGAVRLWVGWLMREKGFGAIARGEVTVVSIGTGLRLCGGLAMGSSVVALVVGHVVGILAQLAVLRRAIPDDRVRWRKPVAAGEVKRQLVEYRDFPLHNAPASFLATFAQNLPTIVLGAMFSAATAGLYAMAIRLVGAPVNVMVAAVRRVFLQEGASIYAQGKSLVGPLAKTSLAMAVISAVPLTVLWLFGQELFTFLLGGRWSPAGQFAELLVPLLYAQAVAAPSNAILIIIRRQGVSLAARCVDTAGSLAVFGWAYWQGFDAAGTLTAVVALRTVVVAGLIPVTWMLVPRGSKA